MTYIYKLDNNSLIAIILFLQTDDIYEYSETCKMFYNITKYIQKLPYIPNYLKFNKPPCDYHYVQSINLIKWAKQHKNFNYTNILDLKISIRIKQCQKSIINPKCKTLLLSLHLKQKLVMSLLCKAL